VSGFTIGDRVRIVSVPDHIYKVYRDKYIGEVGTVCDFYEDDGFIDVRFGPDVPGALRQLFRP
jgi:ribosomal protein L21E